MKDSDKIPEKPFFVTIFKLSITDLVKGIIDKIKKK